MVADRRDDHARADGALGVRRVGQLDAQRSRRPARTGPSNRRSRIDPRRAVDHTFTHAGRLHVPLRRPRRGMSGTGHGRGPGRRPARERARVLQDGRLPARLDPGGHRGDPGARRSERLRGHRDRGRRRVHDANLAQYDAVVFLSTTGDVLNDDPAGGVRALHPRRRRLRRHPRGGRHRVRVDWYGEMLGGYFRNHPAGTPTASVDIVDTNEPSTQGLPARWTRTDEWYNYQASSNPVVNGAAVPTISPRTAASTCSPRRRVDLRRGRRQRRHDDDHPISWCSDFDGGRIWYTGMGHTEESFGTGRGTSARTSSAAWRPSPAPSRPTAATPRQATPAAAATSRRSRSTTTRRTRWSSTSRPTAACSTSSATGEVQDLQPGQRPRSRRRSSSRSPAAGERR